MEQLWPLDTKGLKCSVCKQEYPKYSLIRREEGDCVLAEQTS